MGNSGYEDGVGKKIGVDGSKLAVSVKTETDAVVVKPECETVPDESRLIVDRVCSEADDDETEFEDT